MKCATGKCSNRLASNGLGWVADVDRLLSDIVNHVEPTRPSGGFVPALELLESETQYELTFELPGVSRDDLNIEVKNDTVTISGEKKRTELDRPSKVHRLERSFGQFQRTLQFPTAVDFDAAEATFKSGLLHLTIPKSAQAVPRKIQIRTEKNPPEA
jgi:HSP20 family protein